MNSNHCSHHVVIIGSGLAGMSCALHLAEYLPVALIFEDDHMSGATPWAQGGLSAVSDEQDSFEEHIKDTWEASAYQGKKETIVRLLMMIHYSFFYVLFAKNKYRIQCVA